MIGFGSVAAVVQAVVTVDKSLGWILNAMPFKESYLNVIDQFFSDAVANGVAASNQSCCLRDRV